VIKVEHFLLYRTKIWTSFALQNFKGRVPTVSPQPKGTSCDNLKKNCKGDPIPGGGALVRLGHSLAHVKIWWRNTP